MKKTEKKQNAAVPWERQMLYIFQHWEEMHERVNAWKAHVDELSKQLLEERKLRKKTLAGYKRLKQMLAKRDAEVGSLQLRLAKSVEKSQQLAWMLRQTEEREKSAPRMKEKLAAWLRKMRPRRKEDCSAASSKERGQ